MSTVKFRHNAAIVVAGLVALFGAVPVATVQWYLTPILLVPLAVMIWGWRAGTDANQDGLSIRALFGATRVPWERITGFVPAQRRVVAMLDGGGSVTLPAVTPADLPRLVAASGQELATTEESGEPDDADPAEAVEAVEAAGVPEPATASERDGSPTASEG
ncbi:PH domain-containing protein [Rugosimonospora africana]|uniref:PH domain-containing protein n=1 Tax=Rugosimonospora africana TaxID=556532 RepID=UPI00357172E9